MMDYTAIPAPVPRPISRHSRELLRRELQAHGAHGAHEPVATATPEVISSLITSLSVISRPASAHFDLAFDLPHKPSPPPPSSPRAKRNGSFGVDYGAFVPSTVAKLTQDEVDLDDLAATPPTIKTAKPPSGFSALTATKPPDRRESGGLRGFRIGKNNSRPSSRGSSVSRDADLGSLGNVSVERDLSPASSSEVKTRRSCDSWGRKAGHRAQKGLMYVSSKERLGHSGEQWRAVPPASGGSGSNGLAASAMSWSTSPRPSSFLAETAIVEERLSDIDLSLPMSSLGADDSVSPTPRTIPNRDSSLRRTGPNAKRPSMRHSRSLKRDSDHDPIPEEVQERSSSRKEWKPHHTPQHRNSLSDDGGTSNRKQKASKNTCVAAERFFDRPRAVTAKANHFIEQYVTDTEVEAKDVAPSPSIAQRRRKDRESSSDRNSWRRSGRSSPEHGVRRSSSRLKRLSVPLSATPDDTTTEDANAECTNVSHERPASADSIDGTIEAYLHSPRLSQKIRHAQTGRVISFSEVGDSEGSAVFCCVGMGLTRYITAFYDELAVTLRLRLITPDRPGIGDSEPYADGTTTPLSWPDDVYAICQALKITKFSVLAHSAGAIYALATALRMPQHIRGRIHLLAPWIPPSQMSVLGASAESPLPPTNAIPTSQKILRVLPTPILKAANSSFMTATSSSITSSLPKQSKKAKRKANGRDKDALGSGAVEQAILDKELQMYDRIPPTDKQSALAGGMVACMDMDLMGTREGASPAGALSPMAATATATAAIQADRHGSSMDRTARRNSRNNRDSNSKHDVVMDTTDSALADKKRQEKYDARLTCAIWDLATTGAHPAVDLLVCLERRHTIGFRYVDITRPVIIHHGTRDTRVPVDNVRWIGKMMKRCEVRVLEGEGHGLMASAAVMGGILMDISKEWDDWMKVTGATTTRRDEKRWVGVR